MPLKMLPLPKSEWEMYFKICYAAFVPGIMDLMYPNGFSQAAQQHSVASFRRQDDRHPGRIQCFKVIDTDLSDSDPFDKVVGVSHWKIFPRERTEEEMQKEKEENDKDDEQYPDPAGPSTTAIEDFGEATKKYKDKHLGRKAHVLLHVLATRPGHERRGVGAIGLKWGTDKADELGLPSYLEGSPKGVALYKKWGYEVVDTLPFDATKHGYPDPLIHMCMLRQPQASLEN